MKIGLLGYGTVGRGAYAAAQRAGVDVKLVLDVAKSEPFITTDINDILRDPEIEAVAEAIGGLHPAYEFALAAMKAGKHYTTANKALVCEYYDELSRAASDNGVQFRCTPAVGGGIQWLPNLVRAKRCDNIIDLFGIVNGTTNYILCALRAGREYSDALREAQALGYAELDPTADVMGYDARRKCAISASAAFDTLITGADVLCEGIANITLDFTKRLDAMCGGGVVKLVARAGRTDGGVYAFVQPEYVRADGLLAAVDGCYNLIGYTGENIGVQSYFGSGAGKLPTGAGLMQDILDMGSGGGCVIKPVERDRMIDNSAIKRYYIEIDGKGELVLSPVMDMFERAEMLRSEGKTVAFAAIEDEA